ncbi:hypothetical protein Bbelb_359170 [Branchiostoma belcheri]|nr:hypothetical protein Bbelb_359170 [Branchiostoma belcheri]
MPLGPGKMIFCESPGRSHCALTALSLRSLCDLKLIGARRECCESTEVAMFSLAPRSHGALTAFSRRSHGALKAFSRRSHGVLTALIVASPSLALSRRWNDPVRNGDGAHGALIATMALCPRSGQIQVAKRAP